MSFDPYPPTIGIPAKCLWRGFLILMYCDLWTIGRWGHPSPPKTCWRLKWMVPKVDWYDLRSVLIEFKIERNVSSLGERLMVDAYCNADQFGQTNCNYLFILWVMSALIFKVQDNEDIFGFSHNKVINQTTACTTQA